jgi:curved DNA-binding protein CbpA
MRIRVNRSAIIAEQSKVQEAKKKKEEEEKGGVFDAEDDGGAELTTKQKMALLFEDIQSTTNASANYGEMEWLQEADQPSYVLVGGSYEKPLEVLSSPKWALDNRLAYQHWLFRCMDSHDQHQQATGEDGTQEGSEGGAEGTKESQKESDSNALKNAEWTDSMKAHTKRLRGLVKQYGKPVLEDLAPWELLAIDSGDSQQDWAVTAKKHYRALSKLLHPDKNPSAAAATVYLGVQAAYEKLRNGNSDNDAGGATEGAVGKSMNEKVREMYEEWSATRSTFPLHHDERERGYVLGLTGNTFSSIYSNSSTASENEDDGNEEMGADEEDEENDDEEEADSSVPREGGEAGQPRTETVLWLVMYYTPWCHMSQSVIPYMRVATRFLHWQFNKASQFSHRNGITLKMKFGAVKCSVDAASKEFCKEHNIDQYPTFRAMGVENGQLMFETQYDFQHQLDPLPDGLIRFAQKSARLYQLQRQLIVPLSLEDMGGGTKGGGAEGVAEEGADAAAEGGEEEDGDEQAETKGEREDDGEGEAKKREEGGAEEGAEEGMPSYFKAQFWVVLFDKPPHRGGSGGGSGSNDPLDITSTLPPSRMATVASAWAAKLRGRARFGLALCGRGDSSSDTTISNLTDPCLAEGVGWLPEMRVYGKGKGLGEGHSLTGRPIDDEWMAEVALRAMEAVVMATTEEDPEWKGGTTEAEFDELRNHMSDTAEEPDGTPPPPPPGGGGGSCGPNGPNGGGRGRRPAGAEEAFIWSGEGPGGQSDIPDFGSGGRKGKPAGLISAPGADAAREKRKKGQGGQRHGRDYTHTLPKKLQNALKSGTQRLGN